MTDPRAHHGHPPARPPLRATRRQLLVGAALRLAAAARPPRASATPGAASVARMPRRQVADSPRRCAWARDTWHSLDAMTDPATGLPADNIPESLAAGDRCGYTSPTNIGGYLWSTIVARDLGIISAGECTARLTQTLRTLGAWSTTPRAGCTSTGTTRPPATPCTTWPEDGNHVEPFVSSVDSGWLGAALLVVKNAGGRTAAPLAAALFDRMRWDAFYDPARSRPPQAAPAG